MEHSKKDIELSAKVKGASEFARHKKFDNAIRILDELIDDLSNYNLDHSAICVKIIPYFQKAGRFPELETYISSKLIPVAIAVRQKAFSHQNDMIQDAYCHLLLSEIFDKVRLCAKREKIADLEALYSKKSNEHYEFYLSSLERGEAVQSEESEKELKRIFGSDKSKWPDSLK